MAITADAGLIGRRRMRCSVGARRGWGTLALLNIYGRSLMSQRRADRLVGVQTADALGISLSVPYMTRWG